MPAACGSIDRDLATMSRQQRTIYRRTTVGFIFQSYYLVASLTAAENVALALTFQGVYGAERTRLAAESIARVGLAQRAAHRPSELSGGEQQRVAIARAIVHRPRLLLADEPTGNLDRATASEVIGLIGEIHRELGTTVVMVSHDEEMATRLADRVLRLRDGRLEAERGDCGMRSIEDRRPGTQRTAAVAAAGDAHDARRDLRHRRVGNHDRPGPGRAAASGNALPRPGALEQHPGQARRSPAAARSRRR